MQRLAILTATAVVVATIAVWWSTSNDGLVPAQTRGLACTGGDERVCDVNANCTNSEKGPVCACSTGYAGDGMTCARNPARIVAVPDTQRYVTSDALALGFNAQARWIADNVNAMNIKFVSQLGDIVNSGDQPVQWTRAKKAVAILDSAGVQWGTAVGNHGLDRHPSSRSIATELDAEFDTWRAHFGAKTTGRFDSMPTFGGSSGTNAGDPIYDLNTYYTFTDGARRYVVLHLEFDVPDRTIAWAQQIIDAHPGMPTIVATHVYLGSRHGPPHAPWIAGPGRNAQVGIWDKLIKHNSQIFLIMSGHTGQQMQRVHYNSAGQPVLEMVADYVTRSNGGGGWLRVIELDELASEVRMTTFTPGVPSAPGARSETTDVFSLDWAARFDGPRR